MALSTTSSKASSWLDDGLIERLIIGAVLAWLAVWCVWSWRYWEDDAYIHLAYARSVAMGQGFMFNGLVSNGDTAPLWVLVLALAGSLADDWRDWVLGGKVLSVLTLLASCGVWLAFARQLMPATRSGRGSMSFLLLALVLASPFALHWACSGMEAVAASAWVVAISMSLSAWQPSWRHTCTACLLIGLGPLLRPEFVLMAPVALPFLWRHAQAVWQGNAPAKARLKLLIACLLLIGPLLLWSAYALNAFGYVMPNTNAAKREAPHVFVPLRMLKLTAMGFPSLLLACAGLAWMGMRPRRGLVDRDAAPLVPRMAWPLLAWCTLVLVFYVVNHTHVQTRYLLVLGPGLTVVTWAAMVRRWGEAAVAPWLVLCVIGTGAMSLVLFKPLLENKLVHDQHIEALAQVIRERVSPKAPIAIYSIGQIGFLIPNPIVDIGGITQPSATPYLFGPMRDMVAWARRQGAQYFVSGDPPELDAVLVHHMTVPVGGWFIKPGDYDATEDINLWRLRQP